MKARDEIRDVADQASTAACAHENTLQAHYLSGVEDALRWALGDASPRDLHELELAARRDRS